MLRWLALTAMVALAGCPTPTKPAPASAAATDISDWRSWPKTTAERMWSRAHARVWVDVHVDPGALALYRDRSRRMPAGTRIVKALYKHRADVTPLRLTAMVKMQPGYDPDDGDWYYAVVDADGVSTRSSGRIGMCINCHILSEEEDYLYRPTGSGDWEHAFPGPPPS